jgi:hypothetical protein
MIAVRERIRRKPRSHSLDMRGDTAGKVFDETWPLPAAAVNGAVWDQAWARVQSRRGWA